MNPKNIEKVFPYIKELAKSNLSIAVNIAPSSYKRIGNGGMGEVFAINYGTRYFACKKFNDISNFQDEVKIQYSLKNIQCENLLHLQGIKLDFDKSQKSTTGSILTELCEFDLHHLIG